MENIIVPAERVWAVYIDRWKASANEDILLAKNEMFGVEIYLSINSVSYPNITVIMDDEEVCAGMFTSQKECEEVTYDIYDQYLFGIMETVLEDGETEKQIHMEAIVDRDEELNCAIDELLTVFDPDYTEDFIVNLDKVYEELKDMVSEYIYARCGVSIYRPMEFTDGSFSEYPYGEVELKWFYEVE